MAEHSKIEWTDTTWNPLAGCTPVSPGCRNCYAATHARRLAGNPNEKVRQAYAGTARTAGDGRAVFTGKVNLLHDRLTQPFGWRKPRRVFVNAMSDLFHESVPFGFVDQIFAVMALTPQHTYQVLTKRPERMAEYLAQDPDDLMLRWCDHALTSPPVPYGGRNTPRAHTWAKIGNDLQEGQHPLVLPNVWLGTSVEDQACADERIPHLLRCPAAVRFLSCEPLLGPVDLRFYRDAPLMAGDGPGKPCRAPDRLGIHWVIPGGESGTGARPCDARWILSLVEQCQAAGVAPFVKQLGSKAFVGHDSEREPHWLDLHDPKGGNPEEWPEDLRVREFPHRQE